MVTILSFESKDSKDSKDFFIRVNPCKSVVRNKSYLLNLRDLRDKSSPPLHELTQGLESPVDAQAVAADGFFTGGERLGGALPSLFGCLTG